MIAYETLDEVLKAFPSLGRFGFNYHDGRVAPAPAELVMNEKSDGEEIEACRQWIRDHLRPRVTINIRSSSYGLKHRVEANRPGYYVSTGHFIAAMLLEGYKMKAIPNSPNAHFNFLFRKGAEK